jgi:hypothetical protein
MLLVRGEWQFKKRLLTIAEQRSFREEYGKQAPLLVGTNVTPRLRIRGFILNGRKDGWNLSVEAANHDEVK